ncbi:hypothetical protein ABTX15_32415 [Micromonospora sp. NPDC094482]|uniref:hypothetical protein n=1 Tax=unclassified Micromonospora TaxID=2617518 RepID=UPI003328676C
MLVRLHIGPPVNTASPSRLSTTVAGMGDARPPPKIQWPSDWSCSLKASIEACSSAVAKPAVSSSTDIRCCLIEIISCGVAAPSDRPVTPATNAAASIRHAPLSFLRRCSYAAAPRPPRALSDMSFRNLREHRLEQGRTVGPPMSARALGWKTPAEVLDKYLRSLQQPSVAMTD